MNVAGGYAAEVLQSTALVVIPAAELPTILAADKNDILGTLMRDLAGFTPDGSTEAGRKACRANALKVGKAKQDFIRLADGLKSGAQKVIKSTNAEVRIIEERFDALRDRFLEPDREYKNREAARVAKHEAGVAAFADFVSRATIAAISSCAPQNIRQIIAECQDASTDIADFEEFMARAVAAKTDALSRLAAMLEGVERKEAEAIELARLRDEEAKRKRRERDFAIAEQARKDAEAKAEAERRRVEKETADREAALKADVERKEREATELLAQAERGRQNALAAAKQADDARIAGHRQALAAIAEIDNFSEHEPSSGISKHLGWLGRVMDRDWEEFASEAQAAVDAEIARTEAALVIARDREAKAEQDRQRQADEEQARRDAQAIARERADQETVRQQELAAQNLRETDTKNRAAVNNAALAPIVVAVARYIAGDDPSNEKALAIAKAVLTAIIKAEVPNVSIKY